VSSSRCRRQPVVTRVERDDFVFFCHLDLLLFGLVAPKNADWTSGTSREVRISATRKELEKGVFNLKTSACVCILWKKYLISEN
jgi:hypothetical protein